MHRLLARGLAVALIAGAASAAPAHAAGDPTDINKAPQPVITGPTYGAPGSDVVLSSQSSSDPDGQIVSRAWKVTGATVQGASDGVELHVHLPSKAATVTVSLTVTDDGLAGTGLQRKTATATQTIKSHAIDPGLRVKYNSAHKPRIIIEPNTPSRSDTLAYVVATRDATDLCGHGPAPAGTYVLCPEYTFTPVAFDVPADTSFVVTLLSQRDYSFVASKTYGPYSLGH